MFGRKTSEFQSLYKQGQNTNVWNDKIRKPMCIKIEQNFGVWKDKMTILIFMKIGSKFK